MLPGPYERWFIEACGRASPVETRSTCDACAMLPGAPGLPDGGALGAAVWNLVVVGFNAVERVLARRLLAAAGLDAAACDALLHAPSDPALDARAWGAWRGREEDYFAEAAHLAEAMSWAEVAAL